MPVYGLSEEDDTEVYGLLDELAPAPEEKARARRSALSVGLENTSPALLDVFVSRTLADARTTERLSAARAQQEADARGYGRLRGIGENGISPEGLNILLRRQHRLRARQEQIEIGGISGFEQMGLGFLASAPDPINLVPGFAGAKATTLAGAVGKGVLAGTTASVVAEPAYFALSRYAGDDYTLADSAINVAFGAALGAGFGGAGYGLAQVGSARERRVALAKAADQAARDERIDVSDALPDGVPDLEIVGRTDNGVEVVEVAARDLEDAPANAFERSIREDPDEPADLDLGPIGDAFGDGVVAASESGVTITYVGFSNTERARRLRIEIEGEDVPLRAFVSTEDNGKILMVDTVTREGGNYNREFANTLGPRQMLRVYRAMQKAFPQAETITGLRITGARRGPASRGGLTVPNTPLRPRRGPAANDASVAALADAIESSETPAPVELSRSEEVQEIQTLLDDDLNTLDAETRAEVEDEFTQIDEAFSDEGTYINTLRAAVTCALSNGAGDVS